MLCRGAAGSTIEIVAKNTSSRASGTTGPRDRRPTASAVFERQVVEAERKAAALIDAARAEAARIRRAAESDAKRTHAEAEEHARRLVLDARASADGVRAEGMELVSNLREMGDVLRSNAERLLHDIQSIHTRMVGELTDVDPGGTGEAGAPTEAPQVAAADEGGPAPEPDDALDVPDFVSRG
jgi:cell division septum initiation protein DivIVA